MEYEFSKGTLAIVPNDMETSLIYEDNDRYFINQTPFKIMEESCKYFGSSYDFDNNWTLTVEQFV